MLDKNFTKRTIYHKEWQRGWRKRWNYSFTLQELIFFLFGKKKCPKCGQKLMKEKTFETRTELLHGDNLHVEEKYYHYNYHCEYCGFKAALSELSKKNK